MRILIVDDKEESRYLLEVLLKGNGYHVEAAANGSEALEALRTGGFDLIVSDILMPVMDGFQLCREVKASPALKSIPLVFYTATYTGPKDEEFAMKVGADRFIRKPCEPDELLKAVQQVLEAAVNGRVKLGEIVAVQGDAEIYKVYNERLVRKLEQKMLALESEIRRRETAENELETSSVRLQLALQSANIGLWSWDQRTDEVWFSPEWKRQIGHHDHEISNRYEEWEKRLHPEDRQRVLAEVEAYLTGNSPIYRVDFRLRHKDGSYRWITAMGEKIPGPDGKPDRFTGCHVDITRYKEAVQSLETEKKKFQVLVDESPLGVALLRDDRYVYLNPRFTEIFGYTLNDFSTRDQWFEKAYPDPDYKHEVMSSWQHAKDTAEARLNRARVLKVRCADGSDKLAQIVTAFLAGGQQVITYEDVSEQKLLEEKLRQTQKMEAIATLAGGIAHDFNNILSAIIGFAELAKAQLSADSPVLADIEEILTAGNRAKDLTKHILAFSRQTEHERIPLALHLVVKEVLSLLRSTLPSTIEIREDAASSGMILGDSTQIHQVIMNLCTNAYHAMRETGGVLEVGLKEMTLDSEMMRQYPDLVPGNYVRLTVSDTGCGMTPEVVSRIFDPYYTTKIEDEGTGLGLAVVHGIVTNHGGTITVYSELGKGSVFHVYFPLIERASITPEDFQEGPPVTGDERILFVDDEPVLANLAKQMLQKLGYKVVTRTSGVDALELFRNRPEVFDLVITDMTMPRMTGAELAKELMQIRPDIPVILCTGFSYSMSEAKAKAIGIREFAMKPIVMRDVAAVVRKVLDQPR